MQTRNIYLARYKFILAIPPGLFVLGSELHTWQQLRFSSVHFAQISNRFALLALCVALCTTGYVYERRFAVWSFPALGLLLGLLPGFAAVLVINSFFEPGPPSHLQTFLVNWVLPSILWVAIVAVLIRHRYAFRMSLLAWALLGLLIVTNLVIAWPVNVWSLKSISWGGAWLLFPVAIGLLFASSHGLLAGMIVVAGLFWWANEIYDPSYAMWIWSSNYVAEAIVSVLPSVSLLIVSPVWTLLARSTRGRILGLLIPPLLGLASGEVIRSVMFLNTQREYSLDTWLVRSAGALEIIATIALAVVIYRLFSRSNVLAMRA